MVGKLKKLYPCSTRIFSFCSKNFEYLSTSKYQIVTTSQPLGCQLGALDLKMYFEEKIDPPQNTTGTILLQCKGTKVHAKPNKPISSPNNAFRDQRAR